jgi:hypothetical protein
VRQGVQGQGGGGDGGPARGGARGACPSSPALDAAAWAPAALLAAAPGGGLPELACAGCGGLGSGGPARGGGGGSRLRGHAVCPADTRGPQEIEVLVYFPAGVDMQCWASIFWSWICKWDLKASL